MIQDSAGDAFLDGGTQPCELGLAFLIALFQEAQALAHHFAGIAEPAGRDAGLDETVEGV